MSYIELNNVMYRGTLTGASGAMRLNLTGSFVAVETLNVRSGSVTWSYRFGTGYRRLNSKETVLGYFNVPDQRVWLEITASASGSGDPLLVIDGIRQPGRVGCVTLTDSVIAYKRLLYVGSGSHRIGFYSATGGHITRSLVLVKYIRQTGGDNL